MIYDLAKDTSLELLNVPSRYWSVMDLVGNLDCLSCYVISPIQLQWREGCTIAKVVSLDPPSDVEYGTCGGGMGMVS